MSSRISINAVMVTEEHRMAVLPKHFGRFMLLAETTIYNFACRLVRGYSGGDWNFFEVTNGGFYMAPRMGPARVFVEGNGFDSKMSADAIGITVCLFAFSHLSFHPLEEASEMFADHYHDLRAYARAHEEHRLISAAIN